MNCATHPEVETTLRCSKCGKPICPRCMVQTPVGARCPDCARLARLPTFSVSSKYYLRAAGSALGVAIVCGTIWGMIGWLVPFFSFNLILAPLTGYAIGEVVSLSVNRKRGTGLAITAGIGVVVSYLINLWFVHFPFGLFAMSYQLVALALGIFVAVTRLR